MLLGVQRSRLPIKSKTSAALVVKVIYVIDDSPLSLSTRLLWHAPDQLGIDCLQEVWTTPRAFRRNFSAQSNVVYMV